MGLLFRQEKITVVDSVLIYNQEGHLVDKLGAETSMFLDPMTIEANSRFFASADDVPKRAYTMGIGSIFAARQIILIATGKKKAAAIKKTVLGEVAPHCPASILQFHPHATLLLDKEAAALL